MIKEDIENYLKKFSLLKVSDLTFNEKYCVDSFMIKVKQSEYDINYYHLYVDHKDFRTLYNVKSVIPFGNSLIVKDLHGRRIQISPY